MPSMYDFLMSSTCLVTHKLRSLQFVPSKRPRRRPKKLFDQILLNRYATRKVGQAPELGMGYKGADHGGIAWQGPGENLPREAPNLGDSPASETEAVESPRDRKNRLARERRAAKRAVA